MMAYSHIPVLLEELIEGLNPVPGENLVDGTLGGGGHSAAILKKTGPDGKLLGIDMDDQAIDAARMNLSDFENRIFLKRGNFVNFTQLSKEENFGKIDLFILDLGISSKQLDDENLGISFLKNSPLDMRLGGDDTFSNRSAEEIINKYSEEEIFNIIKSYGEERYASKIAHEIVSSRKEKRITTTKELVEIIEGVVPTRYKHGRIHFATRTFQAFRIAVNDELGSLKNVLPIILDEIEVGGRIGIISFHSLEDRIVKEFFVKESKDCICDVDVPVCVCGHKKRLEVLTKKPITASEEELSRNPRSRSAKLRLARKIL